MIVLAFWVFGILLGALVAKKYRGNWKDVLHYCFVFGIVFALIGLSITVVITRLYGA